ncbi:cyclic lactone autoinducer peptide [Serpentinicella sp. ANB-PHB4]|nr:cyclic lactone autoinducer peptide [Serpentinicella sp. ANB-PHB4]MDR5658804.1 cyclic lactone autoinducer peptide [Serpentinicella sp. ANB-PHB4]
MIKLLKRNILTVAASLLTVVAMSGVSTTSWLTMYEPEIPESIKKEL